MSLAEGLISFVRTFVTSPVNLVRGAKTSLSFVGTFAHLCVGVPVPFCLWSLVPPAVSPLSCRVQTSTAAPPALSLDFFQTALGTVQLFRGLSHPVQLQQQSIKGRQDPSQGCLGFCPFSPGLTSYHHTQS